MSSRKEKPEKPECFFCGGTLQRVHDHFRLQANNEMTGEPLGEPKTFCGHDRCIQAASQLTGMVAEMMQAQEKTENPRRPTYFG